MTRKPDAKPTDDNVVPLSKAFETPDKKIAGRKRKEKTPPAAAAGGDGAGDPPPPADEPIGDQPRDRPLGPDVLPPDSPVTALGTFEGLYFYIDALGQIRETKESDHSRLGILSRFGGNKYLAKTWPLWAQDKSGEWYQKPDFNHALIAPAMIESCHKAGQFVVANRVRGRGCWEEANGELVMHCGQALWHTIVSTTGPSQVVRTTPGIHGNDRMLYPRQEATPEPIFDDLGDVGPRLLEQLETWNWRRGRFDAQIIVGWLTAAIIGSASPWRPAVWVTGGKGTGKSTVKKLIEWTIGKSALIAPENTTPAYVYQQIGRSCMPVALDEFEAKEDNRRVEDVLEILRISSSGGTVGRGGSENNPTTYTIRSCFVALSIIIPPLTAQHLSRLAICELDRLREKSEEQSEFDLSAPDTDDLVLGSKEKWARTGAQLRGRVLHQWQRYKRTYKTYVNALQMAGQEHRAAEQFGALGAAYDIAMYDALDPKNAIAWAMRCGEGDLPEITGYTTEGTGCLQHLLAYRPNAYEKGNNDTIAAHLRRAKRDKEQGNQTNDATDANKILGQNGIRVYRDAHATETKNGVEQPIWMVAIASSHRALSEIFKDTHWKSKSGAVGAWAQALRGLEGAAKESKQMRIDDGRYWVTRITFDAVIAPFNEVIDRDEIAEVAIQDRTRTEKEERGNGKNNT